MANQKIHEYPLERFVYGDDDYYDIDYWDGLIFQTAKIRGSVIKNAILTGIAINLTAPSAFIVGGSPTDGTGTLTLTAAGLANQYIRGDGTLATLPTSGGGGNNVNYYLNGGTSASVGTYYQMSKTAVIGTAVDFSLAGNGLISQWLTDVNDPNLTEIPAGNWNFEMFFSASSSGGTPQFYIELLKYDGVTFTSISDNSLAPESITSGTLTDLYLTSVPVPYTTLLTTDRLAIRIYIVNSVLGRTITHHTQDSHLCQVITTFSSGLSSINGLTKQTQYLAVGTSGTDFAINSATDTHTFNLPTASATKRGALSSANWSTFNGKQNAITLTTTGSGVATFTSDVLNIPTPTGGSGIFGIPNASGVYTYYATLTLAMAAAVSGNTIEMFADVTETGAVTVTLKNGVNINGNGHTYTLNNSGLTHALTVANTVATSCNINNLNVIRTGSTGNLFDNTCLILGISGSGVINCAGSTFRNSGSGVAILFNTASTHEINYAVAYSISTYGAFGMFTSAVAKLNNCIGYGTSGGTGIRCHNGGDIQNCTGISDSGYGIFGLAGNQSNSVGISTSGSGFYVAANAYNCVGRSTSGVGFEGSSATNVICCVGVSVSGIGLSVSTSLIYNCTGISGSSRGVQLLSASKAYNLISKSTSSYSILANAATIEIHNSNIICDWNNAGGIGISSNTTILPSIILNSTFLLANATAPYLFNGLTAQAVSTRGNTYKGGGAYSVLITQAIVTTEDTQGNIFL
jgi:hypothetical protein